MRIDDQSLLPATSVHSLEAKRATRTRDLAAQADEINRALKDLSLAERLKYVRREIDGKIVLTTGFGMESQVILHHIAEHDINIEIATLDTGRLFPETYKLWEDTERRYNRRIRAIFPRPDAVADLVDEHGINGFYKSKDARLSCCNVRKVEPLKRALSGAKAWVAGLRGSQSVYRAGIGLATANAEHKLIKVNPLFDWSREDVLDFVSATTCRSIRCTIRASPRSAARPAPARSCPAKTSAPAAGGGKRTTRRNAACTGPVASRSASQASCRSRLCASGFSAALSPKPFPIRTRVGPATLCAAMSAGSVAIVPLIATSPGRVAFTIATAGVSADESRRNGILDKLRQRLHRHVDDGGHAGSARLRQSISSGSSPLRAMAGDVLHTPRIAAAGQRDAEPARRALRRGDAGHDLDRDAGVAAGRDLLAGAAEDHRIAALEPHHAPARPWRGRPSAR